MGREVQHAVAALKGKTFSLQDARPRIPKTGGIYAWWIVGAPLPCVPVTRHPKEHDVGLVYIGIAPHGPGTKSTLRSRVVGNHLNGNIAASTLRRTLASLLIDELS